MTEAEWLASDDPRRMLPFLRARGVLTERKRRLFTVACCRRIHHLMTAGAREAVRAVERFADGRVGADAVRRAWAAVGYARTEPRRIAASAARAASYPPELNFDDSSGVAGYAEQAAAADRGGTPAARAAETAAQAHLLRDISGNPFRPVNADRSWLTSTVVSLAQGTYAERAFDRLPILADALQDAGCDSADALGHCRDPRLTHVRGCWVVDLVLGKT
jgi:hypothetical protein